MTEEIQDNHSINEIPAVSKKTANGNSSEKYFWPGLIGISLIGLIIIWFVSKTESKEPEMTASTGEKYVRERAYTFEIPEFVPTKEEITEIEKSNDEPQIVYIEKDINNNPPLTKEELLRQQELADLRERRKRSPMVIYDQLRNGPPATLNSEHEQLALLRQLSENNEQSSDFFGGPTNKTELNERLNQTKLVKTSATVINKKEQKYTITQGKLIGAVLETAIHTDLAGMTRAIVSENIYSFDGELLLLEKGTLLIGEYASGVKQGQTRVFVLWSRAITPYGVDIDLLSPGTDTLGRSGLSGWVDNHFIERFGASALLSIISGGASYVAGEAAEDGNNTAIINDVSNNFNRSSEIALENSINIEPTIHKNQGDLIKIFVARDLDFKQAYFLTQQQRKLAKLQ